MNNPFSDITSFENLRTAALKGDEDYSRYRRREGATARRHVTKTLELRLAARVTRMVEVAIASSRAVLLVGPPGTGKTEILEQMITKFDQHPEMFGLTCEAVDAVWVTPEEEWTFEKLVLGETVVDGEIESVEGDLLQAIRRNQWLVLDETNRADMDRVLGGVLTWLSGKRVRVGSWRESGHEPVAVYLDWVDQPESVVSVDATASSITYAAGSEWRILGTYNAVDAQRVFRMGQALSRRFKHVPIPPASAEDFTRIIGDHVSENSMLEWLTDRTTRLYSAHLGVQDAELGPGLFVDIPAYVEKGVRLASYASASASSESSEPATDVGEPKDGAEGDLSDFDQVGEGVGVLEDPEAVVSHVATGLEGAAETGGTLGPAHDELLEELLTEAYLVSAGNVIAKYEPEVLDELTGILSARNALNPSNLSWFRERLRAMRA